MNSSLSLDIEPERYEFFETSQDWEWTRREFFHIAGSGVVIALFLGDRLRAQPPGGRGQRGNLPQEIAAWLHIGEDSAITVYTGKVELGQNIRTSLTQVVAEELTAPIPHIQLVMADTSRVPFDMGTFGSMTTPVMAAQLRRVAAAAREVLVDLAAEESKLDRGSFTLAEGKVAGPNGNPSFDF